MPGYTDKGKSLDLARKLEKGEATPDHLKFRKTLVNEHLEAFKQHLEAQNDSPKHVRQTYNRIKAVLAGCGWQRVRNVSLPDMENWLAEQRENGEFGIQTSNYYGRDFKSFMTWLVDNHRAETNPVARFAPLNSETDDKRERRVLSEDDFAKLIAATLKGEPYRRVTGQDRALLYIVASNSGLRCSELASLTRESFDLDAGKVIVRAAHSKRRREDEQPLRPDLVALLRPWLAGRFGRLWPGSWANTAAAMLQIDLKAAKLPYTDDKGQYYDFHALRHQYISGLARAGVPLKVSQVLARHSTIQLTMDRYSHLLTDDATAALAKLPPLPNLTQNLTQSPITSRREAAQNGTIENGERVPIKQRKPLPEPYLAQPVTNCYGNDERGAGGSRTHDGGFAIRCLSLLATAPVVCVCGKYLRHVAEFPRIQPIPNWKSGDFSYLSRSQTEVLRLQLPLP